MGQYGSAGFGMDLKIAVTKEWGAMYGEGYITEERLIYFSFMCIGKCKYTN